MSKEVSQDSLFDIEPVERVQAEPVQSMESLVEEVRRQRHDAIVARQNPQLTLEDEVSVSVPMQEEASQEETGRKTRKGGAFGGALRRRLDQAEETEEITFDARDLEALAPTVLQRELFSNEGDQSYQGVIFGPEEFKAITFAPNTLAKRIGNQALAGTIGREPSDRLVRKDEIVKAGLERQLAKAEACLADLAVDEDVFQTLAKEMKSPGYAHMGQEDMDALMAHSEGVYVSMFEAILTNRGVGTERVRSLTAAMYYLLENPDYQKAFRYRKHLTNIGLDWTRNKINRLTEVRSSVQNELDERFGQLA